MSILPIATMSIARKHCLEEKRASVLVGPTSYREEILLYFPLFASTDYSWRHEIVESDIWLVTSPFTSAPGVVEGGNKYSMGV